MPNGESLVVEFASEASQSKPLAVSWRDFGIFWDGYFLGWSTCEMVDFDVKIDIYLQHDSV